MGKTRLSLFYLATYLWLTGVGFVMVPAVSLKLLMASGTYDLVFVRVTGGLMCALGGLIVQVIRHRLEVLYPTTLVVRGGFIILFTWIFTVTRDPLFLAILGVVSLGFVLTGTGYVLDRRGGNDNLMPHTG